MNWLSSLLPGAGGIEDFLTGQLGNIMGHPATNLGLGFLNRMMADGGSGGDSGAGMGNPALQAMMKNGMYGKMRDPRALQEMMNPNSRMMGTMRFRGPRIGGY